MAFLRFRDDTGRFARAEPDEPLMKELAGDDGKTIVRTELFVWHDELDDPLEPLEADPALVPDEIEEDRVEPLESIQGEIDPEGFAVQQVRELLESLENLEDGDVLQVDIEVNGERVQTTSVTGEDQDELVGKITHDIFDEIREIDDEDEEYA